MSEFNTYGKEDSRVRVLSQKVSSCPEQVLECRQVTDTTALLSVYIHIHRVTEKYRQRVVIKMVGMAL